MGSAGRKEGLERRQHTCAVDGAVGGGGTAQLGGNGGVMAHSLCD